MFEFEIKIKCMFVTTIKIILGLFFQAILLLQLLTVGAKFAGIFKTNGHNFVANK